MVPGRQQERDKENDWSSFEPGSSEAGAELDGVVVKYFQVAPVQKIQFPVQNQATEVKNLVLSFSHETGLGKIR